MTRPQLRRSRTVNFFFFFFFPFLLFLFFPLFRPQSIYLSISFEMIKSRSNLNSNSVLIYRRHFLLLILFFNVFSLLSHAECYHPDGSVEDDIWQPCDPGDDHSMCCATNRDNADRCRSDGFCFSVRDLNLWRNGCTDPTWKSPKCNKICIAGKGIRKIL